MEIIWRIDNDKNCLKGFDPCDRIKANGPVPRKHIHQQLNDKENR